MFRRCKGALRSIRGCLGCISCQKRLRLSWEVEECKPLPVVKDNESWASSLKL